MTRLKRRGRILRVSPLSLIYRIIAIGAPMEKTVSIFPKNSREQVRVTLSEFHGRQIINIRVFWTSDGTSWNPSKKGLAIGVEKLPILLASLYEAAQILGQDQPEPAEEEAGILTPEEKAILSEELKLPIDQLQDPFLE